MIDTHQHFWKYTPAEYGWIDASMTAIRRDCLPEDARAAMIGTPFREIIAVQARQTVDETRWLLELAGAHPAIVGVIGWVDLCASDIRAQLQRWAADPKLVGVRHIVQDEPDDRFLLRPDFARGIALLEEFGLTYDVLIHVRHLPVAVEFVSRFPRQRFVLDHLAKPEIRARRLDPWARDLRRLGACPNVCAKLSGLVTEADWGAWTAADLRPYLDVALEVFGPDRLMVGSDWPVCTLAAPYAKTMAAVTTQLAALPASAQTAVLDGNARRCWNLPASVTIRDEARSPWRID